jgi:hypothetical protein
MSTRLAGSREHSFAVPAEPVAEEPAAPAPTPVAVAAVDDSVDAADGIAPPSSDERVAAQDDPVAEAAAELLNESEVLHWSQAGVLGPDDLTIRIQTPVLDRNGELVGHAGFNLRALHGYRDAPKCNLLAFEIAFRAGFVVPLVGRALGWGFPASGMLADDAADGRITGDWALVRRRPDARELNIDRELGAGFLAVGSAAVEGRYGHVAVIDWIDGLELTREGEVQYLSFLGWEAKPGEGARYGQVRFASTAGDPDARFEAIYILELRPAEPGNEVAVIGSRPLNPTAALNLEGGR